MHVHFEIWREMAHNALQHNGTGPLVGVAGRCICQAQTADGTMKGATLDKFIVNVFNFFKQESENGSRISLNRYRERTCAALKINRRHLLRWDRWNTYLFWHHQVPFQYPSKHRNAITGPEQYNGEKGHWKGYCYLNNYLNNQFIIIDKGKKKVF